MMNPTDWTRARIVPATATRPSDLEIICQALKEGDVQLCWCNYNYVDIQIQMTNQAKAKIMTKSKEIYFIVYQV